MTNMTQPEQLDFYSILLNWYIEIQEHLQYPIKLARGSSIPISDWMQQSESDQLWYYALDGHTEHQWHDLFWLAKQDRSIDSVHVTTALYITAQLDEDLLHELEIPGVWIVRVQKT